MSGLGQHPPRPERPASNAGAAPPTTSDVAARVREAAARAEEVEAQPAAFTLEVRASSTRVTTLVATPDTTVGEVLGQAARDLAVPDPEAWTLVVRGEVLGAGERRLSELGDLLLGDTVRVRLVRRPEAGRAAASA
jgi:hypothetical protein